MGKSNDFTCYPAAGVFKAQVQNTAILLVLLVVSTVLIYYCTLLLVKMEREYIPEFVSTKIFLIGEIAFVLGAIGVAFKCVTKRMAYFLSPTALLIQYGRQGYEVLYQDIQEIQLMKRTDFFNADLREGGSSVLFRSYGLAQEAFLFRLLSHLQHGSVFICATTKADEYLLLRMNDDNIPSLLISAEKFNEFWNDLKSRLITTPSIA